MILSYSGVTDTEDLGDLVPESDSVLFTRARVLQEGLLSSRVLYFGTKRMYLECFTNVRFENCHYPINWQYQSVGMVEKQLIGRLGSLPKYFQYWRNLVTTYSETCLTHATDKLPALSGLASEFQQETKTEYLAGIWKEDISRQLVWYVFFFIDETPLPMISASDYIAPSWSWASAKLPVQFINSLYSNKFHSGLELIDSEVIRAGSDPFGRVKSGFLKVSGFLENGFVRQLPDKYVPGRCTHYLQSEKTAGDILAEYAPDDITYVSVLPTEMVMLYLGRYSTGQAVALAIGLVDGQDDTYRRVGLMSSDDFGGKDINDRFRDLFRDVEKCVLLLI